LMLFDRCQLHNRLAHYTFRERLLTWRIRLNLRRTLLELLSRARPSLRRVGKASRFAPGSWVRIRDADEIRRTLNSDDKLRGLAFVSQMWPYCGTTHRVLKPIRRLMDDAGHVRPVARTVLLATPCGGVDGTAGCGRECPLWYRDEWLQEVPPPADAGALDHRHLRDTDLYATVKSAAKIDRTLDRRSKHRGLMFMPEMYAYEGMRFRVVKKVDRVWELRERTAVEPIYILEGLNCSGAVLGPDGPCDRGCRLLWHEAWLNLEQTGRKGQRRGEAETH